MTILEKIIAYKKKELTATKKYVSVRELEQSEFFSRSVLSLSDFILDGGKSGIVAEFKRKSPSKGIINADANVAEVTKGYSMAGASGLSILTDREFFGGTCEDLIIARKANDIPILRKDFIIDEYQVVESKAIGADAILLIAATLEKNQLEKLLVLSHSLNLEVLIEIHSLQDLEMINEYVDIIGVNNRDLKNFSVDTGISIGLAEKIPHHFVKISESGISTPSVIKELRKAGYDGFLIGETFMKSKDPVAAFSDFTQKILFVNDQD